jgi:molybdopterin molybdotransferase
MATQSLQSIADALAGYDPRALPIAQAQAFIQQLVQPVQHHERVRVGDALGRILATPVISPMDVPAHDNSAMDGYACRAADLQPNEESALPVMGAVLAGAPWAGGKLPPGVAIKITTGAVMPTGLDTVVPQELISQASAQSVVIPAGVVRAGDNRRLRGEDLRRDGVAVPAGTVLGPAELGLIASLGIGDVAVWRRLRVAYFSTGDEIHSIGEALSAGGVYDSNRFTMRAMLQRLGMEVIDLGVVRDDPVALEAAFRNAASQADAVITSGGVSVGEADHTKQIMAKLGDVLFWRIAMRPGRPMAIGRLPRNNHAHPALLFGLPGNPVAVMVTFYALVRSALLQMGGATMKALPPWQAISTAPIRKKPGRTEYQRGFVQVNPQGRLEVAVLGNQGSGVLSSMSEANGLIVLDHDQADVNAGDLVNVVPFQGLM